MRVYTSLTRPKLRNGCDWKLNALNVMVSIGFAITCLNHLCNLWIPILIYYVLRRLFRWTAEVDPQWIIVYTAAFKLRSVFLAHADPEHREKTAKRVIFKRPRWSV
jgi:type IV secretory pathway TrbD component